MESVVISRSSLPEPIYSYIQSEKILVSAENGSVILKPVKKKNNIEELCGKYPKLSTKRFLEERRKEEGLDD